LLLEVFLHGLESARGVRERPCARQQRDATDLEPVSGPRLADVERGVDDRFGGLGRRLSVALFILDDLRHGRLFGLLVHHFFSSC
jgi:hypothetical protein